MCPRNFCDKWGHSKVLYVIRDTLIFQYIIGHEVTIIITEYYNIIRFF